MEMWEFATQAHNDGVVSSVAVVLSLLLKILSGSLDLVPHGLGICSTLLQERHLKLIAKNLSTDKHKGFVISPTLRLLREMVELDGGAAAKRLFRARSYTMAELARNLEVKHLGESPEDETKTSVRTHAIRFLMSCLKFLPADFKKDLLMEKHVVSHVTFMLQTDPPNVIRELLSTLKDHVLSDERIPRDVKSRAFSTKTLTRLLGLYTYKGDDHATDDEHSVSDAVHEFLLFVTTDPVAGVLCPCKGFYPKGMEEHVGPAGGASFTDDSDAPFWLGKYKGDVPVYNFVLSEFIQKLRPWWSLKHNDLLVAIFHVAPELVSNYFATNKSFTFEPKLSMTWMGYAAFLFGTIQVPLPQYFGSKGGYSRVPPPTSIVLDNILPLPLTQKALVRCLSPESPLTSFFVARLLVISIEKLKLALEMHKSRDGATSHWLDAERRLMDEFRQRIPDMKEVMRSYKSIPEHHALHREAASRLLLLYYEIVPQVALALNLDVSQPIASSLKRLSSETPDRALYQMELENLISIASYSPGMRWFSKSEGFSASPFTLLLQLSTGKGGDVSSSKLGDIDFVAVENQLVLQQSGVDPLRDALEHLTPKSCASMPEIIWSFLDNCASRCSVSPIKYHEMLQSVSDEARQDDMPTHEPGTLLVSLLIITMLDQLPFVVEQGSKDDIKVLRAFLSNYLSFSISAGEDSGLLTIISEKMTDVLAAKVKKPIRIKQMDAGETTKTAGGVAVDGEAGVGTNPPEAVGQEATSDAELGEALHVPRLDGEDTAALTKWWTKSVEDLLDDGHVQGVVRLVLSPHTHIRKEALANILKMAAKIRESSYSEKDQVWLLLSEFAESSRPLVDAGPGPTFFVAFTIHALEVLKHPLHSLYPQVNNFLGKQPVWPADRVPFAHEMLHGTPSEDDKYYAGMMWFLAYALDGLSTPADLAVFHTRRFFEKMLTLGGNPYLRAGLKTRIQRIIYRATTIEGGSTTLATRFGVLSWLEAREAMADDEEAKVCGAMIWRVWETCDQAKIRQWSDGGVDTWVCRYVGRSKAMVV